MNLWMDASKLESFIQQQITLGPSLSVTGLAKGTQDIGPESP